MRLKKSEKNSVVDLVPVNKLVVEEKWIDIRSKVRVEKNAGVGQLVSVL